MSIKKDALDNVINGGSNMDLDKIRNKNKKSYASRKDEIYKDHYDAIMYAVYNDKIDSNNKNAGYYPDARAIVTNDVNSIQDMIDDGAFEKGISKELVSASKAKYIIEKAGLEVPKNIKELVEKEKSKSRRTIKRLV
jgi:hypothetical protein